MEFKLKEFYTTRSDFFYLNKKIDYIGADKNSVYRGYIPAYIDKNFKSFGLEIKNIPSIGKWITANKSTCTPIYNHEGYRHPRRYGFHIFLSSYDAQNYMLKDGVICNLLFLVKFKDILIIGKAAEDDHQPTIVAKKICLEQGFSLTKAKAIAHY